MVISFVDSFTFFGIDNMANPGRAITTVQAEDPITNGQVGRAEALVLAEKIDPGFYDERLGQVAWIIGKCPNIWHHREAEYS